MGRQGNNRGRLSVIPGEGSSKAASTASLWLVKADRRAPVQLSLWPEHIGLPAIIALGFDGLHKAVFERVLAHAAGALLVDTRLAPLFRGNDFGRDQFHWMLASNSIHYAHHPELANEYVGLSWNPTVALSRYVEHITSNEHLLFPIFDALGTRPVILLGSSGARQGSELDAILHTVLGRVNTANVYVFESGQSAQ